MKYLFMLLAITLLISCHKDDFSAKRDIAELSKIAKNDASKERYQLRMAFGKNLAQALKEKELRDFIKQKSIIAGDSIYEELIYALIKDERLPSGQTVAQTMKKYEDAEIKELFGDDFQALIAEKDPMIAIKIPDMFYELDWNTSQTIPFVGVRTPTTLIKETYDGRHIFYYHNGYSELLWNYGGSVETNYYNTTKYFHIYVKYSTDHMLLDEVTLINEKGISLFEFLPQIEDCGGTSLINRILASGTRDGVNRRLIYVNKRTAFKFWQETCAYNGTYLIDEDCPDKNCPRNCEPNGRAKNMVLDGLNMDEEIYLYIFWSLMRESENFSMQFGLAGNKELIRRVVVPSVRHKKMGKVKVRFNLEHKEINSEGNCFKAPVVTAIVESKPKWIGYIKVGYVVLTDLDVNKKVFWDMLRLDYDDLISPYSITSTYFFAEGFNREIILNPSEYEYSFGGNYSWCSTKSNYLNGAFRVHVKF